MRHALGVALLFVAAGTSACETSDRAPGSWATDGVDPTRLVENGSTGLWSEGEAWRVEEVLALGAGAGDDVQFGDVAGVEIDADGTVYVADRLAQQILVFGADGSVRERIGRPGAGPGEFGPNIGGVFRLGDELVVPDVANQRVSRFGSDGVFRASYRVSADNGIPLRWDVAAGQRLVAQRRMVVPEGGSAPPADVVVGVVAESVPDTLRRLPAGQSVQITGDIPIVRPFEPEPVWDTTAEGRFVTAMTDGWTFEMRGPDGQVEWVATLPGGASPATAADRSAVESSLREMYLRQGVPAEISEAVIDRAEYGDRLPAFASVALGPMGSLWVQEIATPLRPVGGRALVSPSDMGGRRWTVLGRDGRLLGDVSFPIDFQPLTTLGDTFLGVGVDEFGTESVRAFRVVTQ